MTYSRKDSVVPLEEKTLRSSFLEVGLESAGMLESGLSCSRDSDEG